MIELEVYKKSDFYEDFISSQKEYYEREQVDTLLAEKDREIALLKERICNGDVSRLTWIDDCIAKDKEIAELKQKLAEKESWVKMLGEGETALSLELEKTKQKLESVQASMYCDVVDANMENRRLKRALWLARAKRAFDCKEIFRLELRINELKQTYVGSGYYMVMINKWQNVERKFLKKAEEYK